MNLRRFHTRCNVHIVLTLYYLTAYTLRQKDCGHQEDRRKILQVKKDNPELDLRMVFQAPHNKIYKGSKTTYGIL